MNNIVSSIILVCSLLIIGKISYAKQETYSGFVEANLRYISTEVTGTLKQTLVDRGQTVKKGSLLFLIEDDTQQSDLLANQSELLQTEKTIKEQLKLQIIYDNQIKRRLKLSNGKYIAEDEIDTLKTTLQRNQITITRLKSELDVIKAQLKKYRWLLEKQSAESPTDSIVYDIYFRSGEVVLAGRPIVALLVPNDMRIVFYVPGIKLKPLAIGQPITIKIQHSDSVFHGNISFIAQEAQFAPPVMFSEEQRARLVYEVEAKINSKDAIKLNPGQVITVYLNFDQ